MCFAFSKIKLFDQWRDFIGEIIELANFHIAPSSPDQHMRRLGQISNDVVNHARVKFFVPIHFERHEEKSQNAENWHNDVCLEKTVLEESDGGDASGLFLFVEVDEVDF